MRVSYKLHTFTHLKDPLAFEIMHIYHHFFEYNYLYIYFFFNSPELTWRDIQHLTVLTSKRNSLFDAKRRFQWTMNGVGLEFNHLFGFGVLDAGAMVSLARQWRTVPARYHCQGGSHLTTR